MSTGTVHCDRAYLSETYLDDDLPGGMYSYVEVSDTGCGMDHATQARIFDPFFTTKFTGRGLGLASVLGIIRGHNGALKVRSEAGSGTTFRVLFPAADVPAAQPSDEAARAGTLRGSGTILLVDDEKAVRKVGRRMLELSGFDVMTAANGREALRVFTEHQREIDCVVLDLTMPEMDGEETLRELTQIQSDVRVVLSSGYDENEISSRFAGKGLTGFVQKPYDAATLVAEVAQALGI